jgi:hypothetical protein
MRGALVTIRPGADAKHTPLDHTPGLEELKAEIGGGFLEAVPWFNTLEVGGKAYRCVVFCDEDAKAKQPMPSPNVYATFLWNRALIRCGRRAQIGHDYLAGTVCIVVGDDELLEEL